MTKDIQKTNAARLLDKAKIPYSLTPYEVDEAYLGATHTAEVLGVDIRQLFKTIVFHGDRTGHFVCVVPGDSEVDLKKAAKVSGNKKAEPVHVKELLSLTGYIRGGCSPVGMKKPFPTFFHSSCTMYPEIYVSAGKRGLMLKIDPENLVKFTRGEVADVIKGSES